MLYRQHLHRLAPHSFLCDTAMVRAKMDFVVVSTRIG